MKTYYFEGEEWMPTGEKRIPTSDDVWACNCNPKCMVVHKGNGFAFPSYNHPILKLKEEPMKGELTKHEAVRKAIRDNMPIVEGVEKARERECPLCSAFGGGPECKGCPVKGLCYDERKAQGAARKILQWQMIKACEDWLKANPEKPQRRDVTGECEFTLARAGSYCIDVFHDGIRIARMGLTETPMMFPCEYKYTFEKNNGHWFRIFKEG